ncbi:prolipoprotein diacylglyceryl transferase family protein [Aeoliella sp.]|uniref:prolipoprotein diacylglyceryl transferase family protein n=1 Tax=Aeoliella sp. TaxID=2795800 RepID=UPI003CCC2434
MCSTLFHVPSHLFGVPLFGFGLLLAILVVGAAIWAAWALKRDGGKQDVLTSLPVLAILAGGIVFLPRVFPDGFPIRGYGLMLIAAGASGLGLAYVRMRQAGLNPDLLFSLAFWMFLLGIVGGRVFYVVEYWESNFSHLERGQALIEAVKYVNGGLVVYGALVGATVAFLIFVRRHHLPTLAMADLIAPSLVVGLAFGRIGCLLNGCCFGGVADVPWAVTFPKEGSVGYSPPYKAQVDGGDFFGMHLAEKDGQVQVALVLPGSPAAKAGAEVGDVVESLAGHQVTSATMAASIFEAALAEGHTLPVRFQDKPEVVLSAVTLPPRSLPVHPTQIYSAVNAGLLAWLLWSYYPYRRRDGEVFALLITVYPVARFLLERIRIDESSFFGTGLSISQNVSLVLLAAALLLWGYLSRQPRERQFDPPKAEFSPA